jgi:hypothetical protein
MITKKAILTRLGQLVWLGVLTFVLSVIAGTTLYVFAAFTEPAAAPSESNQDFAQNILGANNADNAFNSSLVTASSTGSIIERLDYLQDNFSMNFPLQRYQVYDDYNCNGSDDGNNGIKTDACLWTDPEYTGEEGAWASTTDTNISLAAQYIASGMVFRDQRTGLYWSDAYDEDGNGVEDDIEDDFCIASSSSYCSGGCSGAGAGGDGCTPEEINAGACDSSKYFCYNQDGNGAGTGIQWSAVDWCRNLSLDADGDGEDEDDWRLPTQKELMTAYINGAANILPHPARYYWSATEYCNGASTAWVVSLALGYTYNLLTKTTSGYYARCVRR